MLQGWWILLEVVREEAHPAAGRLGVGDDVLLDFVEATLRWGDRGMSKSAAAYREAEIGELERLAAEARGLGLSAAVASPILVNGRLWGTIFSATSEDHPMPADAQSRIAEFSELVATAISNVQARGRWSAYWMSDGRLWGVIIANWRGAESPPADTEDQMAKFARLLATAIANADGRAARACARDPSCGADPGRAARRRAVDRVAA
jgi:hypothetical protein